MRHIELVPIAPARLLLVLITDTGRVEQRGVELPEAIGDESIAQLRAVLNACLDGRQMSDAAAVVGDLPARISPADRPAPPCSRCCWKAWWNGTRRRSCSAGQPTWRPGTSRRACRTSWKRWKNRWC